MTNNPSRCDTIPNIFKIDENGNIYIDDVQIMLPGEFTINFRPSFPQADRPLPIITLSFAADIDAKTFGRK